MEDDVLDTLEQLGYTGPFLQKEVLQKEVEEGPKSVEYTKVIEWLSRELKGLAKLDDHINAITSGEDSSSFLLEVSSFLKELCCPHSCLTEGNISQRLQTVKSRLLLIVYLGTELEATRMVAANQPEVPKAVEVEVQESSTANDLKTALIALGFPKPPPNITAAQLFTKMDDKVKEHINLAPPKLISKPLFTGMLNEKQWHSLSQLHKEMCDEYRLRREMLLKRLDVTIQSFQWSGKAKSKTDEIAAVFVPIWRQLKVDPQVNLADLLAAREDLAILEKTSNSNVRKNTGSSIHKVIIGRVPDRGGRPDEQQAPPPEMPSWQKRTEAPQGSGRGRGGGWGGGGDRGGGGGRVQSGWANDRGSRGGGGQNYRGGGGGRGKRHQDGYHHDQGGGGGYGKQQFGHPSYGYDAAGAYTYHS